MGFEDVLRDIAFTMARFAAYAAHILLFGLVATLLLVLRPSFADLTGADWDRGRARVARRLEGLVQACLLTSLVATLVGLLLQSILTAQIRGSDLDKSSILAVFETTFGQWYALRVPLLAGLTIMLVARVREWSLAGAGDGKSGPSRAWWVTWALLGLGLLATSTLSGHATVATPKLASLANDLLHMAASSVWFAGVIVLAVVLPGGWQDAGPTGRLRLLAASIGRFSNVAMVAISFVAITGTVNSLLHVGKLEDLIATGYGRTLAVKILLFLAILGLGGINHFFVREKLRKAVEEEGSTRSHRLFRKTIALELAIAIAIVAVTGLLVGLARTKPAQVPEEGAPVTWGPTS